MPILDLADFVARLEAHNELIRITAPVNRDLEITEITERVSKGPTERNKALLFEHVDGSALPVLTNAFGSARRMAMALNVAHLEELRHNLARLVDPRLSGDLGALASRGMEIIGALRRIGVTPKRVRPGKAPCQEITLTENPSLDVLPILTSWPDDAGPFITLPQVITRDPVTGARNVGLYPLQKLDARTLRVHWPRHAEGADHARQAQERGMILPCAVALGGDPALMWSASAPLPPHVDEYLLAAWLNGKPVPFVQGVTQDIDVPAHAEIVIEGTLDPGEAGPVIHVSAITQRRSAIYPATVTGMPPNEATWMSKAAERLFLPLLQLILNEIDDYAMPARGFSHPLVIASIAPRYPGHAQKVMYGLWGTGLTMLSKVVIVVDSGVNVHDPAAVARAVREHVDWQRDITFVDGPADPRDFSAHQDAYGGKMGIDATRKARDPRPATDDPPDPALNAALGPDRWHCPQPGLLLVHVDGAARSVRETLEAVWTIAPGYHLVALDRSANLRDLPGAFWRALAHFDARRDVVIHGQQVGIDATRKAGWLPETRLSAEIVQRVSARWDEYGIG